MLKTIIKNKKVSFDYYVLDVFEAGILLKGTEVKSIRQKKVNINDSFITFKQSEMFITNMHISKYDFGNIFNHDESRPKKLLLHKHEIIKLFNRTKLERLSIIPLEVYLKDNLIKVKIGLCKGKKLYDKRNDLKEKDQNKDIQKTLKHERRKNND